MLKSAGTCMTYKGSGLVKLEHPLLRATKPTWHVYMRLLSHCPSGSAQHQGGTAWTAQDQASLMKPADFFSIFLLPCADAQLVLTPCLRTHMRYESPPT